MSADKIINIIVTVTLIEMMIGIGLGATFADVVGVARNVRLVARAALANYVCVPAITLGLLLLFHEHPMVAAGILMAAVCPGGPYGPPFTGMAKGNVTDATGLMVILAGSSALVAPLLLHFLLPVMAGDQPLKIDVLQLVGTLLVSQLIPLCVGLVVRQWRPQLADRLKKPFGLLSLVLNLLMCGTIFIVQFHMLEQIKALGFVAMLLLVTATVIVGWLLGGTGGENRRAMAMTTSVRNVGVSLVIATASFPGTPAVTAALAFAIFQTIVLALLALVWGKVKLSPVSTIGGARA